MNVRTAFSLALSEDKTEIMCLHEKDTPTVQFGVFAAGELNKQTDKFVYFEEMSLRRLCSQCSNSRVDNIGKNAVYTIDQPGTRLNALVNARNAAVEMFLYRCMTTSSYAGPILNSYTAGPDGRNRSAPIILCPIQTRW